MAAISALAITDTHVLTGARDGVIRLFASDDVFNAARRGSAGLGGPAASTADSQQSGESCGQEVVQGMSRSLCGLDVAPAVPVERTFRP